MKGAWRGWRYAEHIVVTGGLQECILIVVRFRSPPSTTELFFLADRCIEHQNTLRFSFLCINTHIIFNILYLDRSRLYTTLHVLRL